MERLTELKRRLDGLRPLTEDQLEKVRPFWRDQAPVFVYATNAVEGSTLTLGETTVVLQYGTTIGGKTVAEHLDAINGEKAYVLMLELAKNRTAVDRDVILALHAAVESGKPHAGQVRSDPARIVGSRHVPPNWVKIPQLLDEMLERYQHDCAHEHPVVAASHLHFDLLTIHPFADGNGRTSRLVENLHLIGAGYAPILIGPEEKPRYFDVLQRGQIATPGGNATEFVEFMADLEEQALRYYLNALETAYG